MIVSKFSQLLKEWFDGIITPKQGSESEISGLRELLRLSEENQRNAWGEADRSVHEADEWKRLSLIREDDSKKDKVVNAELRKKIRFLGSEIGRLKRIIYMINPKPVRKSRKKK